MSGKLTTLADLGKTFEKLIAEIKKEELIAEFRRAFQRAGYPPSVCQALAEEKYKQINDGAKAAL